MNYRKVKTFAMLTMALFLFQGFNYSELFMSKQKRAYRQQMKETILRDWNQKSAHEHETKPLVKTTEKFAPVSKSLKESKCKEKDIEEYQLAKGYLGTAVNNVTAYYCPAEQQYWISELRGDIVLKNNWYGPFEL